MTPNRMSRRNWSAICLPSGSRKRTAASVVCTLYTVLDRGKQGQRRHCRRLSDLSHTLRERGWLLSATKTPQWFCSALQAKAISAQLTVQGCEIRYWSTPKSSGPTLVLVHGGGAHADWWRPVAAMLASAGHRVVALDLSGHGDSGRRAHYSLDTWAQEVLAVADAASDQQEVILLGHSMGGLVALTAAATDGVDSVHGVIVVDSRVQAPPRLPKAQLGQQMLNLPSKLYPDKQTAVDHFRLVPRQPEPASYMVEYIARSGVRCTGSGAWTWKFDPNVFTRHRPGPDEFAVMLQRISCRTAVFQGELSPIADDDTRQYFQRWMSDSTPFVVIPAAHHHVFLDQPLAFVAATHAVLSAWGRPGSSGVAT